ncbi:MAG: TAXI family TRAP transporter solute-binding subunit [Alphaproteobacteria bacterium]
MTVFFCAVALGQAYAQTSAPAWRASTTQSTGTDAAANRIVGIIAGNIDSASLEVANDLSRTLNEYPILRIVPMVGTSAIQNINDLFALENVDLAIVNMDVLTYLKRNKRMPGIEERIRYIAKLHSEEFHLLSRMKYMCLAELTGRKVNFGPEGSSSALTAQAVFAASKVQVQPQYLDPAVAIEKLRTGEIDATVFVSGKPTSAFSKIRYTDSVHFLDVAYDGDLQQNYLPAIMTHDDYPDLIAPNETVSTIAVSAVLITGASSPKSPGYKKLTRFVERFFSRFDELEEKPNHTKWREVNFKLPISGWARFLPAEKWVTAHP